MRIGRRPLRRLREADRGYHETITIAFLRLVAATLQHHGPVADSHAFCEAHPHLSMGDPALTGAGP